MRKKSSGWARRYARSMRLKYQQCAVLRGGFQRKRGGRGAQKFFVNELGQVRGRSPTDLLREQQDLVAARRPGAVSQPAARCVGTLRVRAKSTG